MYDVHLRLIGSVVGDFLLVIIELFFARCFRFVTIHAVTDRLTPPRSEGPAAYCSAVMTVSNLSVQNKMII